MNKKNISSFLILFIHACMHSVSDNFFLQGISFVSHRPQHMYSGKDKRIFAKKEDNGQILFSYNFSHSFKNGHIAETLFGTSALSIQGSQNITRSEQSIVADHFGLSPAFSSTVRFSPFIQSSTLSADCLWMITPSAYLKATIPFCMSAWSLHLNETIASETTTVPFPAGYMNITDQEQAPYFNSYQDAVEVSLQTNVPLFVPLIYGKMRRGQKIGFSDIFLVGGWKAIEHEHTTVLFELITSIPAGNKIKGETLFEPVIGNGKHPTVGISAEGIFRVWEGLEQQLDLHLTGILYHFFNSSQHRSFDFTRNGFLSRYLSLKEFDNGQATGRIVPAVNITTLACDVRNTIVFDGTCTFAYSYNNFHTYFGYNGWIKSKDHLTLKETIPNQKYGIKGTQYLFDPLSHTVDNSTASKISITEGSLDDQITFMDNDTVYITTEDINIRSAQMPLLISHTLFFSLGFSAPSSITKNIIPFFDIGAEVSFEGAPRSHFSSINKHSIHEWKMYLSGGITF